MDQEKKEKVAVFRFGVIFPLVEYRVQENWGEKARILRELVSREWVIPYSDRNYISKATILGWHKQYVEGGSRIEALYPGDRGDKGRTRSLSNEAIDTLLRLRKEYSKVSIPRLVEMARMKYDFPSDNDISWQRSIVF